MTAFERCGPTEEALHAFAVAGRHDTFREAAAALATTPDAVRRHMEEVEASLGHALFVRDGGGLVLTEAGRAYHARTAPVFDLSTLAEAARVIVDAPPTVAGRWLAPQLALLARLHPGIDVEVRAAEGAPGEAGAWNLAIRRGGACWPGFDAAPLWDEEMVVVGAPGRVLAPLSLDRLPARALLVDPADEACWAQLFRQRGMAAPDLAGARRVGPVPALVEAAVLGAGFALVPRHAAAAELREGTLVQPVLDTWRSGDAYVLLRRRGAHRPAVDAVFEFLRGEAASV